MVEDSALKLWSIARLGTTSKEAYAKQLGWNRASGGHWDGRLALLRGFKLIRLDGDQIGLSELGQQLVNPSDPDKQREARKIALLNLKAYRELVESFDGTELPAISVLASRLQFDYGKSPEFAMQAAQAFVESIKYVGMVDASNVVRRAGGQAPSAASVDSKGAGEPTDVVEEDLGQDALLILTEEDADDAELDRALEIEDRLHREEAEQPVAIPMQMDRSVSGGSVSISVSLDLSRYRADEVVQILGALRGLA